MVAFSGKQAVDGFRLMLLLNGLRMEVKIPGYRASAHVPKCSTLVRKEFGFKGRPPKLLAQLEEWVKVNAPTVETSQGIISTLHSNPAPLLASPIIAYVQPDGGLSETPAPLMEVRIFGPDLNSDQRFHVHLANCRVCRSYGLGKPYGGDNHVWKFAARSSDEVVREIFGDLLREDPTRSLEPFYEEIGFGRCIMGEGRCR